MRLSQTIFCIVSAALVAGCSHSKTQEEKTASPKASQVGGTASETVATPAAPKGHVWVAKPDGSKSCGTQGGMTPEQAAAELKKAGIKVYEQKSGQDGQMHMMVCGAATGATVEALIDGAQFHKAEKLGFRLKTKGQ